MSRSPMQHAATERHGDDGGFIRLIDQQLDLAEAWLPAHVMSCPTCGARVAELRSRSIAMSTLLARTAPQPIDSARIRPAMDDMAIARRRKARVVSPWNRRGVRVAAGLVVLAGVAAASPVRGWIIDRIAAVIGQRPTPTTPVEAPLANPSPVAPVSSTVAFVPASSTLTITVDFKPAGGTMTLARGTDARVVAEISGGGDSAGSLLVLPSGLHVRNSAASTADYRVVVPSSVTTIRLRVDDREELIAVTPGLDRRIALGAR